MNINGPEVNDPEESVTASTAFVEAKLQAARDVAKLDFCENPAVDSVYIASSLTTGLGNPTSDVDPFVLLVDELRSTYDRIVTYVIDREDLVSLWPMESPRAPHQTPSAQSLGSRSG